MLADTDLSSPNSGSNGECKYLIMTKRDSPRATVMELLRSHQALQPVCEKMVQFLGADALGSDVVKAFPGRVKKKTCTHHHPSR